MNECVLKNACYFLIGILWYSKVISRYGLWWCIVYTPNACHNHNTRRYGKCLQASNLHIYDLDGQKTSKCEQYFRIFHCQELVVNEFVKWIEKSTHRERKIEGKQRWNGKYVCIAYIDGIKRQFQNLYNRIKLNMMASSSLLWLWPPLDFIIWSICACGFQKWYRFHFDWDCECVFAAMNKSAQYVPYFFICWDLLFRSPSLSHSF